MTHRLRIVLVAGLLLLGGCQGILAGGNQTSTQSPVVTPPGDGEVAPLPWNLAVAMNNIDRDGFNFSGYVTTEGYNNGGVYGVKVEFRDHDHVVLREVTLGNITGNEGRTDSFNVSLNTTPKYIVVRFRSKDPGEGLVFRGTGGYEIEEDGLLSTYHLRNRSEYIYDE